MSTQYSNHRDTAFRRFSTWCWGMAVFGSFGVISFIVYVSTSGSGNDVETVRAAERQIVHHEVAQAQADLLTEKEVDGGKAKQVPPDSLFPQLGRKIQVPPTKSATLVPGSSALLEKEAAMAEKGGEGFRLFKSKACISCHGMDAKTPVSPLYPIIAGQSVEYQLGQMKDIKSGKRNNGQTAAMKAIIAGVSDADMETMAKWIAKQKAETTLTEDHQGAGLFMAKGCIACHGIDAKSPIMPLYPKLAGQNKDYLVNQIKDIKSGVRHNGMTAVMKPLLGNVTEEEIEVIAEWLSTPAPKE